MSIEYMSAVWKDNYYGQTDKAKLLVALAIADTANADGFAFPSVDFIAHKARCRPRGVQEICRQLEKDGKLEIQSNKGRNGTNLYRLLLKGVRLSHPSDNGNSVEGVRLPQGALSAGCGGAALKAALKRTQTVRNRKEPSRKSAEAKASATETSSPNAEFVRIWMLEYESHWGTKYAHQGAKDGTATTWLINTKVPVPELIAIAKAAWRHGKYPCDAAASIAGFRSQFNNIRAAVGKNILLPSKPKGDPDRWAEFLTVFEDGQYADKHPHFETAPISMRDDYKNWKSR